MKKREEEEDDEDEEGAPAALLIGVFFLKERLDLAKVVATIVTLSGAILLRLAR